MPLIFFIVVLLAIFWLLDSIIAIAAMTVAVPLAIFMVFTRSGRAMAAFFRRRTELFQWRFWAMIDGYGLPYTKRNTQQALQVYLHMFQATTHPLDVPGDMAWITGKLDEFKVPYSRPDPNVVWK